MSIRRTHRPSETMNFNRRGSETSHRSSSSTGRSQAFNVATAMEYASNRDFDLLLSDLGLPDGSPGEVMKTVAVRNGTIGVALSGFGMDKDVERTRGYGFRHHLVKPVDVARLDEILHECSAERSELVGAKE